MYPDSCAADPTSGAARAHRLQAAVGSISRGQGAPNQDAEWSAGQLDAVPGGHGTLRRPAENSRTGEGRLKSQKDFAVGNQSGVCFRVWHSDSGATGSDIDVISRVVGAAHVESARSAESSQEALNISIIRATTSCRTKIRTSLASGGMVYRATRCGRLRSGRPRRMTAIREPSGDQVAARGPSASVRGDLATTDPSTSTTQIEPPQW